MSFNPAFMVGREKWYVPSSSAYIWHESLSATALLPENVFVSLLEKNPEDTEYSLSAKMAYAPLEIERIEEPLRSALLQKIEDVNAQHPDTFIPAKAIMDGTHPTLRMLTGQWVIFNQDPYSDHEPALSISKEDACFTLPPIVLSCLDDLHTLHHDYFLTGASMGTDHGRVAYGMTLPSDNIKAREIELKDRSHELCNLHGVNHLDDLGLIDLRPIPATTLGVPLRQITILDPETDRRTHVTIYTYDDGRSIHLALFGHVAPKHQSLSLVFPYSELPSINCSPDGPASYHSGFNQRSGMLDEIFIALRDNRTWPQRERPDSFLHRGINLLRHWLG